MWVATPDLPRSANHPFYARLNQILDEHDFDGYALVGVTVQDADDGDTTTSIETLIEAAGQVEAVQPDANGIKEVVGDNGYHSNQALVDLEAGR